MELFTINGESDRIARKRSIMCGITAVLAIIAIGHYLIFLQYQGVPLRIIRIIGITAFLKDNLSSIIIVISMILFAIYVFAFYNKKRSPLLGISAALIACVGIYDFARSLTSDFILLNNPLVDKVDNAFATFMYIRVKVVYPITEIIIGLSFAIIAIKYLSATANKNMKPFPIIAFTIAIATEIFLVIAINLIAAYNNSVAVLLSLLIALEKNMFLLPFVLFAILCPLKKEETYRVNALAQVGRVMITTGIALCVLQILSMIGRARSQDPFSKLYRSLMGSMYGISYYFGYYLGLYWSAIAGIVLLVVGRALLKKFRKYVEKDVELSVESIES